MHDYSDERRAIAGKFQEESQRDTPFPDQSSFYSQFNAAIRRISECAITRAEIENWLPSKMDSELELALAILKGIHCGLNQYSRDAMHHENTTPQWADPPQHILWRHQNVEHYADKGIEENVLAAIDFDDLSYSVMHYLELTWWEDTNLESMMIDALLYAEISAYEQHVRHQHAGLLGIFSAPRTMIGAIWRASITTTIKGVFAFAARYVIPAVLLIGMLEASNAAIILAILYAAFLIRSGSLQAFRLERDSRLQSFALLPKMMAAYGRLGKRPYSPAQVMKFMDFAADHGAAWPQAATALLERQLARQRFLIG